ncbi:hypothetical protein DM860_011515 [Cuscuta australis]|uniref:Uncharacterized protein n=1 Tax=Cuscuta australis TaxID=267555 RepID=A0A328D3T9_9ASTE|nr:hypothetical protein DM860_011515 [Cuscuta australis]
MCFIFVRSRCFCNTTILIYGLPIAMAECYKTEKLNMLEEAIKSYKRAANLNDSKAIALDQLAKLYFQLGRSEEAAFYYKNHLERMESEEREGSNIVEAILFLVRYYKDQRRFEEAKVHCLRLLDYKGPERELAKTLLRGIRDGILEGKTVVCLHLHLYFRLYINWKIIVSPNIRRLNSAISHGYSPFSVQILFSVNSAQYLASLSLFRCVWLYCFIRIIGI